MTASAGAGFPAGAGAANLDVSWIHGSEAAKYNTDPDIQVHAYDEHTYILRQNMAVHYEAPFMFLLFGGSRALLLDTGATSDPRFFPLRRTVDAIIDGWLASQQHPGDYGLLVLHTHSHTDHTAADGQFADRPDTAIVGAKRDAAWPYFGFADEPQAGPGHAEGPQPPAGSLRPATDDHYAGRLKACPRRCPIGSLNGSRGKVGFQSWAALRHCASRGILPRGR